VEKALADQFSPYDRAVAHVNALLIKTGKDVVLVDTGTGGAFGPTNGRLKIALANAGVSPKDVTALVVTHAHPDHVGALMPGPNHIDFPNAQFFVHKAELDFWLGANPDLSKSGVTDDMKPTLITVASTVLNSIKSKATILDGDKPTKIVDGVEAILAPGHTPGHVILHISSGSEQMMYVTDAAHHYAIVLPHPDWYVGFDTDRDLAVKTRKSIFDRVSADKVWVAGAHLPFPAFGHVRAKDGAYEWVPGVWEWA
jgi:glyoxylase-like metal-dependent hydrolase (beta-lactamase superfamily II)